MTNGQPTSRIRELLERSTLGSAGARRLIMRTTVADGRKVVERAAEVEVDDAFPRAKRHREDASGADSD